MLARSMLWALSAISVITPIFAAPTLEPFELEERATCTKKKRLAGAELIIYAYNLVTPGASAANFEKLPLEQSCHTYINPNGGPPIIVANDKSSTIDFAINTRQVFSKVTGAYTDYANNDTTVIHTNVTLGALHGGVSIPVTFYADVFLFYDTNCLLTKIQAFAIIPTVVDGFTIQPPILNTILAASPLHPTPPSKRDLTQEAAEDKASLYRRDIFGNDMEWL